MSRHFVFAANRLEYLNTEGNDTNKSPRGSVRHRGDDHTDFVCSRGTFPLCPFALKYLSSTTLRFTRGVCRPDVFTPGTRCGHNSRSTTTAPGRAICLVANRPRSQITGTQIASRQDLAARLRRRVIAGASL